MFDLRTFNATEARTQHGKFRKSLIGDPGDSAQLGLTLHISASHPYLSCMTLGQHNHPQLSQSAKFQNEYSLSMRLHL